MGFFDWLNKDEESEKLEEVCIEKDTDFSYFYLVTNYIYEKSGITDLDKRALTSSRLQQYAISENIYTTDEFLALMKSNHEFYQEIINIATINETFFLREIKELEWLVKHVKELNRPLSILSMPCSSGEEIYSILILLSIEDVDISKIKIIGYDINSHAISHAKEGEYDEHSLHKLDSQTIDKYFSKNENNHYVVSSYLKTNVEFIQKNIFDLVNTNDKYDIILSRNMFIYFDSTKRKLATNIIADLLKTDGIYVKGHADQIYAHKNLENIHYGVYKKII